MKYAATLILTISSSVAFADTCTFTTECFEGDGCYETDFSMEVTESQFVTDAETIIAAPLPLPQTVMGLTPTSVHIVTRSEDGSARYTTHMIDGPMMISYLGTCE